MGLFITRDRRTAELRQKIFALESERDMIVDKHQRLKDELRDEIVTLKDQLEDVRRKKKHEEEDIAHLVKIKESKLDLEYQRKVQENDAAKDRQIALVKDEYRNKLETQLKAETDRITKMYGEILARLPNVNVRLKGDV